MVIVAVAITTLLQLSSQGLRLLKLSGDHQHAALLADRLLREVEPAGEEVGAGQKGAFAWERRIAIVPVARELSPPSGPTPQLYSVSVSVRWAGGRSVEAATLRTAPGGETAPR